MRLAASGCLLVLLACGADLPRPPYVQQTTSALVQVGYPPPPARAEIVPPRPPGDAVWIDGEWVWQGRRWAWRKGRWVTPPKGARFSPWTTVRAGDGSEYWAEGAWRDANGKDVAEPSALASAKPTVGGVVDPAGEREQTGRSLRTNDTRPAPTASLRPASPQAPDASVEPPIEPDAGTAAPPEGASTGAGGPPDAGVAPSRGASGDAG